MKAILITLAVVCLLATPAVASSPGIDGHSFSINGDNKDNNRAITFVVPNPKGGGYNPIACVAYNDNGGSQSTHDRWGSVALSCGTW